MILKRNYNGNGEMKETLQWLGDGYGKIYLKPKYDDSQTFVRVGNIGAKSHKSLWGHLTPLDLSNS